MGGDAPDSSATEPDESWYDSAPIMFKKFSTLFPPLYKYAAPEFTLMYHSFASLLRLSFGGILSRRLVYDQG